MEKNKIIKEENHIIFIDRLADYHIKNINPKKDEKMSNNNANNIKKKKNK